MSNFMTESDKVGEEKERRKAIEKAIQTEVNKRFSQIYAANDIFILQELFPKQDPCVCVDTMEDLNAREEQRAKDKFAKKIIFKRFPTPGGGFATVPVAEEEKFYHGSFDPNEENGQGSGGQGDGEEGDILGEEEIDQEGDSQDQGPGQGEGGDHEIGEDAYKYSEDLIKDLQLPPLKDKGKKVRTNEYTYDLTDRYIGSGQLIDKSATIKRIIKTNLAIPGNIDRNNPDPSKLLVARRDIVYRVLSREKVEKSMAVVFFIRDYSGSMGGIPTEVVVYQHEIIYFWLLHQYEKMVIPRFILHDTSAKEVFDFYEYYNSRVAGGTQISSAYKLVNKIIEDEDLERDYNIFIFQGTDGDDWDTKGVEAIPELTKLMALANRIGVTIVRSNNNETDFEKYLKASSLLDNREKLRMFYLNGDNAIRKPEINIECIKRLVSP